MTMLRKVLSDFRRLQSRLTETIVDDGSSFTVPGSPILDGKEATKIHETPESHLSPKYKVKDGTGGFELVGFVKRGRTNHYYLKHILTNTSVVVSDEVFGLLFEKIK